MKKITIDKYIAIDGKPFDNEKECVEYEKTIDRFALIRDVPIVFVGHDEVFPSGGSYDQLVLFKINNVEQARHLVSWCIYNDISVDAVEKYMVGRVYVLGDVYTDCECPTIDDIKTEYVYGHLQTLDQYLGNLTRNILSYADLFEKENTK